MHDAALEATQEQQRTRQRGRQREAQHEVLASRRCDRIPPVPERSPPPIGSTDPLRQDDPLVGATADDFIRQYEDTATADLEPADAAGRGDPLLGVHRGQVFGERPARDRGAFDIHAVTRQSADHRVRIIVQCRRLDDLLADPAVRVPKAYELAQSPSWSSRANPSTSNGCASHCHFLPLRR
jgi:hypothetical protein